MSRRRRGFGPRAPPKSQQKALVQRAKSLADDYSPLLPECTESCPEGTFKKTERALSVVKRFAGDRKRLEKLASKGDLIARGYAGMLMIADAGEVPYVASTHTPFGDIIYAVRGKAPKEVLVGTQNYHDKRMLLLAYMPFALKKDLHFYATRERLYCSGRSAEPPDEYIREAVSRIPYRMKREGNERKCRHLAEGEAVPYLSIEWVSAGLNFMLCEHCASKDRNLFALLTEGIGAKDVMDDFIVKAEIDLEAVADPQNCPKIDKRYIKKIKDRYVHGKISDRDFIIQSIESGRKGMGGGRYLIIGRKCYGNDEKAFVDALNPGRYRDIAEIFVNLRKGAVMLDNASLNKLMDQLWKDVGKSALEKAFENPALAEDIWKEYESSGRTPLELIEEGMKLVRADKKLKELPDYDRLGEAAEFCDAVARTYLVNGVKEAVKTVDSWPSKNEHIKAIAYAFLIAMHAEKGKEWQYTQTERELGNALGDISRRLLVSKGDEYHRALVELLKYAGINEKVVKR